MTDLLGPDFSKNELIPAIAQDSASGDVLMMAWMNTESYEETLRTGRVCYYSRSRKKLWRKGEESGNVQKVHELHLDCDNDVVLMKVEQLGHAAHEPAGLSIACHTGRHSCFFQLLKDGEWKTIEPVLKDPERIYK